MREDMMSDQSYEGIELGDIVRDTITGFTGVAVAYTTWLNKCRRIGVQCCDLKDGKPVDLQTFDIEQLVIKRKGKKPEKPHTGGGGRPDAVQRQAATR